MSDGIVAAVGILVVDDHVLLLKRIDTDRMFPGKWGLPGGKVDPGETLEQACAREFQEETGIDVDVVERMCRVVGWHPVHQVSVTVTSYLVEAEDPSEVTLSVDEHQDFEWVDLSQVTSFDLAGRTTELLGPLLQE